MPIIVNVPLPEESSNALSDENGNPFGELYTQRGERFTGYKLAHDTQGNILHTRRNSSQPAFWGNARGFSYRQVKFVSL